MPFDPGRCHQPTPDGWVGEPERVGGEGIARPVAGDSVDRSAEHRPDLPAERRPDLPAERRADLPGAGSPKAPGLGLALGAGVLALAASRVLPGLSAVLVAVVLGAVLANTLGVRAALAPGLAVASRRVLRLGVALLGLQLSLAEVARLGGGVLAGVVLVVGGGIAVTLGLGALLGVPPARRLLIACGTSICGAAAVAAVDGVTESEEEDLAVALGLVVALGSVAMLLLPLLAGWAGLGPVAAGAWLGGSIHEVGQVVVAGGLVSAAALQVAVLVKLARVLLLAPVILVINVRRRAAMNASAAADPTAAAAAVDAGVTSGARRPPVVPFFVAAFVALAVLGSLVSIPEAVREGVGLVQVIALSAGMFALGAGLDLQLLRRLSARDLALGIGASCAVCLLALPLVAMAA